MIDGIKTGVCADIVKYPAWRQVPYYKILLNRFRGPGKIPGIAAASVKTKTFASPL